MPIKLKEVVEIILGLTGKTFNANFNARKYSGLEAMFSYADMSLLFGQLKWRPRYSLINGLKDLLIETQKNGS